MGSTLINCVKSNKLKFCYTFVYLSITSYINWYAMYTKLCWMANLNGISYFQLEILDNDPNTVLKMLTGKYRILLTLLLFVTYMITCNLERDARTEKFCWSINYLDYHTLFICYSYSMVIANTIIVEDFYLCTFAPCFFVLP